MSGQQRFVATDPLPPMVPRYEFDAEDVDELGLALCIRVADRLRLYVAEEWIPEFMRWQRRLGENKPA